MSTYTKALQVELLDGKYWKVLEGFEYYFLKDDIKHTITIPEGYITDFASIPRFFHPYITPHDIYNKAAVVHDYLCDTNGCHGRYNKEEVDNIYYDAQLVLNIYPMKAKIFYKFTDWFGTIDEYDWNLKVK